MGMPRIQVVPLRQKYWENREPLILTDFLVLLNSREVEMIIRLNSWQDRLSTEQAESDRASDDEAHERRFPLKIVKALLDCACP